MRVFIALILTIASSISVYAEPIIGPISHIRDGDTFLIGDQPIRLCGIDAPELGSPEGRKAKAWLEKITKNKTLICIPVGEKTVCDGRSQRTSYDRIVAQCFLGMGVAKKMLRKGDVAKKMVRKGHACDWPKFSGGAYRISGGCTR